MCQEAKGHKRKGPSLQAFDNICSSATIILELGLTLMWGAGRRDDSSLARDAILLRHDI
jgi:hypothetical protein